MLVLYLLVGAILPLLLTPRLLFHYDTTPKTALLCVVAAIALVRMALRPADLAGLWSKPAGRWFIRIAIAQTVWLGVASAVSTRPLLSVFGSGWRQFGLVPSLALMALTVSIAAELCARPAATRTLLRCMAGAGILGAIYGIAQYFDLDPFQAAAGYHATAGDSVIVRPPGTMGHADYFGWWLAVEFFCGIALARIETSIWRWIGVACAVTCGIAVLLSGTRGALLAVAVGAVALFLVGRARLGVRQLAAAAGVAAILAAFYFSPAGLRMRARVVWSGDEPAGGARPLLWRDTLSMAAARPWTGFGPETYLSAFPHYESEQLARQFPAFHHESPHNVALDAMADTGIPGLLLALGWGFVAFSVGRAALRTRSPLAPPLFAAVIASAVCSMFFALFLWPVLATLLVIAMLAGLAGGKMEERNQLPGNRFVFVGVAISLGACLAVCGSALVLEDYRLQQFARHPTVASLRAMKLPLPAVAEDIYASRVLAETCPKSFGVERLECQGAATEAAGRATRTSDDLANAWFNLSIFTASVGDVRGTRMTLEKAIDASPNWFKPHWILARLLTKTGDPKRAAAEAARAVYLDGGHDAEVSQP